MINIEVLKGKQHKAFKNNTSKESITILIKSTVAVQQEDSRPRVQWK